MARTLGPYSRNDLLRMLGSIGEIVEDGAVIGYVDAALRFKVSEEHLGHGGYLEVRREEKSGDFVASEYDALQDPRTGRLYPGGYSAREVWRFSDPERAADQIMTYLRRAGLAAETAT